MQLLFEMQDGEGIIVVMFRVYWRGGLSSVKQSDIGRVV